MVKIEIIPTILVQQKSEYLDKIRFLGRNFKIVQLDVIDGQFVKSSTWNAFSEIFTYKLPFKYEIHLMVKTPEKFIRELAPYKNIFRYIVHVETLTPKIIKNIQRLCQQQQRQLALAINPETDIASNLVYLKKVKQILVMGVHPGRSGQNLLPKTFLRVRQLKKLLPKTKIAVDGGVNARNAKKLKSEEVKIFNLSSYIYNSTNLKRDLKILN